MKNTKFLWLAILLVTSIATTTSCKKECPAPPEPTKEQLLTAHEWLGVDRTLYINDVQDTVVDISEWKLLFAVNKDYFVYDNDDLDEYGSWQLISGNPDVLKLTEESSTVIPKLISDTEDSKKEVLDANTNSTDFKIEKLDEDNLYFYLEDTDSGGNHLKLLIKFKK